jgi:hypothetical protein
LTFAPPSASIFANIRTPTHRKTENKGFTLENPHNDSVVFFATSALPYPVNG